MNDMKSLAEVLNEHWFQWWKTGCEGPPPRDVLAHIMGSMLDGPDAVADLNELTSIKGLPKLKGQRWKGIVANKTFGIQAPDILITHTAKECLGRHCCIHNPSQHHMRDWPQVWRADRQLMERTCEHGCGHPDPDHLSYVLLTQGSEEMHNHSMHGCDGCCHEKGR